MSREIDERDCQHGHADTQQDVIDSRGSSMAQTIEQIVAQVAEGNDFLCAVPADALTDFVRQVIDKAELGKGEPVAWRVVSAFGMTRCILEREPTREEFDMQERFIPLFDRPAPAPEVERAIPEGDPVGYANGDELDNMLSDRTATIAGVRDGWRNTALYTHAPEVERDALRYRWLRPHLFCGSDYLAKIETSRDCCVSNPEGHHLEGAKIDAAIAAMLAQKEPL